MPAVSRATAHFIASMPFGPSACFVVSGIVGIGSLPADAAGVRPTQMVTADAAARLLALVSLLGGVFWHCPR
eukprot:15455317-Alexandrium_andersonii.AAC.1